MTTDEYAGGVDAAIARHHAEAGCWSESRQVRADIIEVWAEHATCRWCVDWPARPPDFSWDGACDGFLEQADNAVRDHDDRVTASAAVVAEALLDELRMVADSGLGERAVDLVDALREGLRADQRRGWQRPQWQRTEVHVAALLKRDGPTCWYCLAGLDVAPLVSLVEEALPTHIDHRLPRSRGGSDHLRNLVLSCAPCNLSKGARLPQEWIESAAFEESLRSQPRGFVAYELMMGHSLDEAVQSLVSPWREA